MIEVYKIKYGMENVYRETIFSLSQNTRTWGHPMKLNVGRFRADSAELTMELTSIATNLNGFRLYFTCSIRDYYQLLGNTSRKVILCSCPILGLPMTCGWATVGTVLD